ncbi:N-acetylmannosaminyltransferase [Paraburkholderia rhizosphaerae]|uniref:N-acetylmannosaminyltransferase n=2 Tax=Paraburkholderia rhizosphaerae TaxID=480658 RepID=A0A4R8LME6_9BURK|nr:N-acetylmannosaminyltransferase [Paraburkholderia rhizosphaerae]
MHETVALIERRIEERKLTLHSVVNVAKLVNMQTDEDLFASVATCDIINIDGMGVVWGARILGHNVSERVAGVDLFGQLLCLSAARGYPVFLLGAAPDVVHRVAQVCTERYMGLRLAGYHHGYFWDDEAALVEKIRRSGARLVFVAITSPKKENFINRWKHELGVDFVMGVGGAFDVIAGRVRRAPKWIQRCGLEWLFRVAQEPRRMWRRYLYSNARFALMVGRARLAASRGQA